MGYSHANGQKRPNSNVSESLCLSLLSLSLMKVQSKVKLLSSRQHFPKSMRPSRVGYSHAKVKKGQIRMSKSLCLSLLSLSLMKVQSKVKLLPSEQHFPHHIPMKD